MRTNEDVLNRITNIGQNLDVRIQSDSSCLQNAKKQISGTTEKFQTSWMKTLKKIIKEISGRIQSE
jgi:hypothetical protein